MRSILNNKYEEIVNIIKMNLRKEKEEKEKEEKYRKEIIKKKISHSILIFICIIYNLL